MSQTAFRGCDRCDAVVALDDLIAVEIEGLSVKSWVCAACSVAQDPVLNEIIQWNNEEPIAYDAASAGVPAATGVA